MEEMVLDMAQMEDPCQLMEGKDQELVQMEEEVLTMAQMEDL